MRSSRKTLVAALAVGLWTVPQLATADEVQEELRLMQERMTQLEERLQATNDELENAQQRVQQQERVIEKAGLDDERSALSGLARFFETVEIGGLVAGSYNYNANDPSDTSVAASGTQTGENTGIFGLTAPHHQDHNSFQVDQVWMSMMKPSTVESRGGFGLDIVYGASADSQGGNGTTGDLPHLYQAYASYLAPIGEGWLIKAGRYETVLGAEVFRMDRNWQVTRGIVWGIQPVNHTGGLVEIPANENVSITLGVSNNGTNIQGDTDNSVTGLGQIKWANDATTLAVNALFGGDTPHLGSALIQNGPAGAPGAGVSGAGRDSDASYMVDFVAAHDFSDEFSAWLNFDWVTQGNDGRKGDINIYAVAAAGRLQVAENTGFSVRGEYIHGDSVLASSCLAFVGLNCVDYDRYDANLWSVTGTIDHTLAENLVLKLEGRYDIGQLESQADDIFIGARDVAVNGAFPVTNDDQFLALLQLLYTF